MLDQLLQTARNQGCSDVHLGGHSIHFRKNGQLFNSGMMYSNEENEKMTLSLLSTKDTQRLEEGQDIDTVYVVGGHRYRVNVYKERQQLSAAIRILPETIPTMEDLGLPTIFHKLIQEPRGLVLITGPTGSGKSTTLASLINAINKERPCHILTIEDPIEYVYQEQQALIHQREISQDVSSFQMALKSAMREDPDVILVGEMRDLETIQAVLTLAETGHLVFSTLHTIGAANTIDRIIDVFPENKQSQIRLQLTGVLNAVITQQLLPTVSNTSRVAAMEIMIATPAIKNLIRENKIHQISSVIQTGSMVGMQSLNMALYSLVLNGTISKETALKYTNNVEELEMMF